MGSVAGSRAVHPNDHVNLGESSNDVIPSAIQVAATLEVPERFLPGLHHLHGILCRRVEELGDVGKTARTHLMDAMPVTLGQEISGWASQIQCGMERIRGALPRLGEKTKELRVRPRRGGRRLKAQDPQTLLGRGGNGPPLPPA